MVMKAKQTPKTYTVKLLRGAVLEDGKRGKAKEIVKVGRNLAKILVASGRGEIVEGKSD